MNKITIVQVNQLVYEWKTMKTINGIKIILFTHQYIFPIIHFKMLAYSHCTFYANGEKWMNLVKLLRNMYLRQIIYHISIRLFECICLPERISIDEMPKLN